MEFIEVNQILNKNKTEFNCDYMLDLYKGCDLGCIYCDGRSSCYKNKEFDDVKAKKDCISILNKELRNKKKKGIISIGILSDPYNREEKELELTREALKLILKYGFGVIIHTKSDLVLRDIDLLKQIHENYITLVNISLSTSNDSISNKIEPFVCHSSVRFEVIKQLKENGLLCGITMKPVIPYITDKKEDLIQLIENAYKCKSDYILTDMKLTLRDQQRDYFLTKLEQYFYGISYQYRRVYNNRLNCETLKWKENYEILKNKCAEYSMYYQIEDINQMIEKRKKTVTQISLFE